MPARSIAGSPGTEPEQPPPGSVGSAAGSPGSAARPDAAGSRGATGPGPTANASLTIRDGGVFVEVDGRVGRLSAADIARLGALTVSGAQADGDGGVLAGAIVSARANEAALLALPGVVAVRAGFKFVDGWITQTPAVVVAVDRKLDDLPAGDRVPPVLGDGTPTDVAVADPIDHLRRAHSAEVGEAWTAPPYLIEQLQAGDDTVLEAVRPTTYRPPEGASLAPVTGPMSVTCHVSPDAGWAVLRPFLAGARTAITLGIYDFTAPHIYRTVRSLLRYSAVRWRATLDPGESLPQSWDSDSNKAEDKPEAWINAGLARAGGNRFESAFARIGAGQTFASAYHIKVAVRDDEATWLSSGNWQSSNQPAVDFLAPDADLRQMTGYNREWNVVVESPELATRFRAFLDADFATASSTQEAGVLAPAPGPDLQLPADALDVPAAPGIEVFPPTRFTFDASSPLTIQPILTPDNYVDVVLDLLRNRPRRSLYFQNQSLSPSAAPTAAWSELVRCLADHSRDERLDVRIIIRDIGPMRKKLESIQAAGVDMRRVRVQPGCHTKGIVIDGSTVLLGSHNWSNEGVEANRDASLLIRNRRIAQYYQRVFLHDWERLARPSIRENATAVPLVGGREAAPQGPRAGRVMSWTEWLDG